MDAALLDRVHGCLLGVAVGDALGMPSEGMAAEKIRAELGWVSAFLPGTGRDLAAGQVTDDTEQTLMLAEAILAGHGEVRAELVVRHLLAWVDRAGTHAEEVLGPSSARAITLLRAGADPRTTGGAGSTNGAAMRIAPVGVIHLPTDLPALVDAVVEASVMSHHTGEAIAGACLVAATISSALTATDPAGGLDAHLEVGLRAAALGARRGARTGDGAVLERSRLAREIARDAPDDATFLQRVAAEVGTSVATHESVPAAIGCLVRSGADPYRAAVLAANIGGDTDTIAAMAAGVAGALRGVGALPADLVASVQRVNGIDVGPVARALLLVRQRHRDAADQSPT